MPLGEGVTRLRMPVGELTQVSRSKKRGNLPQIRLNPDLDHDVIRDVLTKNRRAHIAGIFPEDVAKALYECLHKDVPWSIAFNNGETTYDMDQAQLDAIPEVDRLKLSSGIAAQANSKFQFIFQNYRVDEAIMAGKNKNLFVHRYYKFLNSEAFKSFIRYVSDVEEIDFIDAQATKYVHGHFLTCHDDVNHEKGRRLAMVLNLTPSWNSDWGGLLQFHDREGHIEEAFAPSFNALNLMYVGQDHSVSYVTPFAGFPRLSVTGWVRDHA